jgi:hypothetical protein
LFLNRFATYLARDGMKWSLAGNEDKSSRLNGLAVNRGTGCVLCVDYFSTYTIFSRRIDPSTQLAVGVNVIRSQFARCCHVFPSLSKLAKKELGEQMTSDKTRDET